MDYVTLMAAALEEAQRACDAGEVPIGAVVAIDGAIVSRGFNQPVGSGDPTAHAEIVAIREAARCLGNYRLTNATLCVTIEPCLMCVGALVHARIATLVYGAREQKSGAVISTVCGGELPGLNHRFAVVSGVLEEPCREMVQAFFKVRRDDMMASAFLESDDERPGFESVRAVPGWRAAEPQVFLRDVNCGGNYRLKHEHITLILNA